MRWLSISALLVTGACNALLGLEPTIGDRDLDGIPDEIDNCPDVFNPDQADTDMDGLGDACTLCLTPTGVDLDRDGIDDGCDPCIGPGPIGIDSDGDGLDDGCDPCLGGTGVTGVDENIGGVGTLGRDDNGDGIDDGCLVCFHPSGVDIDGDGLDDACDSCLTGPPHDEDGDGIDDGCDNCPGDFNPGQEVGDDEMLGQACDAEGPSARALFDPFLVEGDSWVSSPHFTVANDHLHADSAGTGGPVTRTTVEALVRQHFYVALGVASHSGAVGFNLKDMDPGGFDVSCTLGADGFVTVVAAGITSTSLTKLPDDGEPIQLLSSAKNGFAGNTVGCAARSSQDSVGTSVTIGNLSQAYVLEIEVDGIAELSWFDAVTQL
jgi:hypothetical protein